MRRHLKRARRHLWLPVAASLIVLIMLVGTRGHAAASTQPSVRQTGGAVAFERTRPVASRWFATWSASPEPATARVGFADGFADQTVRNVIFTSGGGSRVRAQLSNAYGRRPLVIGAAALGPAKSGAAVEESLNLPLRFAGRRSVVIAPGQTVMSDPLRLSVRPLERLAVTVFLPGLTGAPTNHFKAKQVNYVAAGDHVLDSGGHPFTRRTTSWYFVSGLEVRDRSGDAPATVVAFGDSITDGVGSRTGANMRWPNDVARRLASRGSPLSIVNAGISGNRLLSRARCCGESGVARFTRDVLHQAGVRAVIVLEGVNDLGATRRVTAAQIVAAYRGLIVRAHERGVRIFGATLTPFHGAGYWTAQAEAKREAINRWIRHSGAFDGVFDFASAVADSRDPTRLAPAFDSGDHLHPNNAGYRAMARVVDLRLLLRAVRR